MGKNTGRRGRGEGGVERLPSGSWRAEVRKTDPDTGRTLRTRKTFKTKPEALQWIRTAEPAAPGTLGDWLTTWLGLHRTQVAAQTYHTDDAIVGRHLRCSPLAGVKLADLTPLRCTTFLASLSCSAGEKHKAGRTLRMACHAAAKAGLVSRSPMQGVKVPPPPKPNTHSLTPEELATLLGAADELGHGVVFRVAADCGLRPQELAGLQWHDFDPAKGTLFVRRAVCRISGRLKEPKTAEGRRVIRLAPSTAGFLAARPRGEDIDPLFPTPTGGHWHLPNLANRVYKPVIRAAGVRMTPYTLRHTMATLLLRSGVNVKVVSARLGHKDVMTTLRTYSHVIPDDQERAAGVMEGLLSAPAKAKAKKHQGKKV